MHDASILFLEMISVCFPAPSIVLVHPPSMPPKSLHKTSRISRSYRTAPRLSTPNRPQRHSALPSRHLRFPPCAGARVHKQGILPGRSIRVGHAKACSLHYRIVLPRRSAKQCVEKGLMQGRTGCMVSMSFVPASFQDIIGGT